VSELEGDIKNTNITTHNTTPTITVSGLVRRNRTGPMAAFYCAVSSMKMLDDVLHVHVSISRDQDAGNHSLCRASGIAPPLRMSQI